MNLCLWPHPPVRFVYHHKYTRMVHTSGQGYAPKVVSPITVFVPDEFIDPHVKVLDDLHGKVEHTRLVDIDFTDVG
jgi:hypothetical protein